MEQEDGRSGRFEDCSSVVIGAWIEVHLVLGPGLLESAYEAYKGVQLECGYRMDFEVSAELVVEIQAVEALRPVHEAQLISYLRLTRVPAGLLVNFHTETIRRGLRRLTLNPPNLPDLPPSCDPTQKSC